jgi:hypothetical protein
MNDQQKNEQCSGVRDQEIRATLDQHWAASDTNDFETERLIYLDDAVLEYPQSGERPRSRRNIQSQRPVSRAKSGLLSDESLAAVSFGSPNSSSHRTPSRPIR